MKSKEEIKDYVISSCYICPKPDKWVELSKIIDTAVGGNPLTPLVLAGWNFSSDSAKQERLFHQIDYAFSLNTVSYTHLTLPTILRV